MKLLKLINELIKIKSEVNSFDKLNECIDFCENYFSNKNVFIKKIKYNNYPSIFISNQDSLECDVISVGHIDVIPAENEMFSIKIKDGKMYGRGVADMKSCLAVGMKNLEYIIENKINIKYGLLIVSDEETGGFNGTGYWVNELGLKAKVVLDPDGGGSINSIVEKSKGVVIAKLISQGKSAHGSKTWLGIDAVENLLNVINKIRSIFPYYSVDNVPNSNYVSTVNVGLIKGGDAPNQVANYAEATLNFRIIENENIDTIKEKIQNSLNKYVSYEILAFTNPVIRNRKDFLIQKYQKSMLKTVNNVDFIFYDSASDGRFFYNKGMTLITHQATSGGGHSNEEWINLRLLYKFKKIQLDFLIDFNK
ncbi:MAG TPA: M20/M25/M40 family metallo-hydrolase [Rickettsiales bacterium]|nr:M20/M25/M40 family metallo-hydrolase [Rickettsiales bacterium]